MKSVALLFLVASAACSEDPTKEGRALIVIRDPSTVATNVKSRNAAFVAPMPQLQSLLDDHAAHTESIPPPDDVQQEAAAAAVRDEDPYRVNGSILAGSVS